jgi:hypothetical protein
MCSRTTASRRARCVVSSVGIPCLPVLTPPDGRANFDTDWSVNK